MIDPLVPSGYVRVEFDVIDDAIDDVRSFLASKIKDRNDYLQKALDNLRSQA